jgi:hypothetical protein
VRPRFAVLALLLLAGCDALFGTQGPVLPPCQSDAECGAGAVCFPDGCGDPGRNLALVVAPSLATGHFEQDFAIKELRSTFDVEVPAPSAFEATLQRFISHANLHPEPIALPYASPVTFTFTGESTVIPGLRRRQSLQRVSTDGTFRLPVASGLYTLSVAAQDTSLPPLILPELEIRPGQTRELMLNLPASLDLLRVDGRLLQSGGVAVQGTVMEIQAIHPLTLVPLSQRVPVSSGQAGSTGDFTLYLAPEARMLSSVLLMATPRDGTAAVPSRSFELSTSELLREPLELGDFGEPVEVTGRVLAPDGLPVQRAVVYLEGLVNGGGTLTTEKVLTRDDGTFTVRSLASPEDAPLRLTVLPPPDAPAALHRRAVVISAEGTALGDVTCPERIAVRGTILREDGSAPAAAARIMAIPVAPVDGLPLPNPGAEARTGDDGAWQLLLDPGSWRLDIFPADPQLPRVTRFLTLRDQVERSLDLATLGLSRGRRVGGALSAGGQRLANAAVRFYRVTSVEGRPSAVLLAETVADSAGRYEVILPTR